MSLIGLLLIPVAVPIVAVLNTLGARRKATAEIFLKRARQITPDLVRQDYDMVVWPWRFWRWARTLDPSIDDPELLMASASFKRLDRTWLVCALVILASAAAIAVIAWHPWHPWQH